MCINLFEWCYYVLKFKSIVIDLKQKNEIVEIDIFISDAFIFMKFKISFSIYSNRLENDEKLLH